MTIIFIRIILMTFIVSVGMPVQGVVEQAQLVRK